MTGKILEAELRIIGSDKTGAAFAGVIRHAEELKRTLSGMSGMSGMGLSDAKLAEANVQLREQTRLLNSERAAATAVTRALTGGNAALVERTALLTRLRHRMEGISAGFGMYGWMAGGYMAGRTARSLVTDTAAFEHQRGMLESTTGMSAKEVREAVDKSLSMRVPMMSAADNLRAIGELRMVFGSTAEAIKNVAAVQRAAAIMKAVNPEKNAEAESYDLARALELKGVSMDPAHFNRLTNMLTQAINASRGKISGEDFLTATRIAGTGTTRTWSDDFYTRVFPTMIQEMKPQAAGRAMTTFRRQLLGGHMQLQSASEWMRLGLLDPHKVKLDKIGQVKKIKPGALVDSDLFSVDPYAWVQGYLAPALKKKGITTDTAIATELATLFSDRYAENAATILLKQMARIEKDWGLINQAPGSESIEKARHHDPLVAARDLGAGINTLFAALGSPLAKHAIAVMNSLADSARDFGEFYGNIQARHPWRTEAASGAALLGLGYVGLKGLQAGFGLLTGSTALKGSAVALTQSAAALDAAAAKLGAMPGGKQGAPLSPALGGWSSFIPGAAAGIELYSLMEGVRQKYGDLPVVPNSESNLSRMLGLNGDPREILTADNSRRFTLDDVRAALYGEAPKAEITGSADIHVKVEAGDGLIAKIESVVNSIGQYLHVNGAPPTGTAGSTGGAMPEAAPASP